ncbi:hypothetical protein OH687_34615 [Burkholderia anthina]|jgi:hypothetical protein|nr:hypothetical protein OH687_34615 [Burkholderia anthina]
MTKLRSCVLSPAPGSAPFHTAEAAVDRVENAWNLVFLAAQFG